MPGHTPVLLQESLDLLGLKPGESVLDVTVGLGGHSCEFVKRIGKTGSLTAMDADEENLTVAKKRIGSSAFAIFLHANFGELPDCLPPERQTFDAIFADLGLSSVHIDSPERGFTFRSDAPLDMRFDRSKGMTAAMYLSSTDIRTLTATLRDYGEVSKPHHAARAIVEARSVAPIQRSSELLRILERVYGYRTKSIAPQVFQALRIAVNDEVGALGRLLVSAPRLLRPDGRLVVISYHSLEDRLVKQTFKYLSTPDIDQFTGQESAPAEFTLLTKKPIRPSEEEVKKNQRARSAILRAIAKR